MYFFGGGVNWLLALPINKIQTIQRFIYHMQLYKYSSSEMKLQPFFWLLESVFSSDCKIIVNVIMCSFVICKVTKAKKKIH